jgi:hypothetical protein
MTDTPEFNTPIYAAIGYLVTNWAYVEDLINRFVLFFYHECGGKETKTGKAGVPRTQFSRKLNFLTALLNTLPPLPRLAPHKDIGLELITLTRTLAEHRDIIIHSVITHLKPDSLKLIKHSYNKHDKTQNKPTLQRSEYTIDDLLNLSNRVFELAFAFHKYAHILQMDRDADLYSQQ